jgi:hypothetical protein
MAIFEYIKSLGESVLGKKRKNDSIVVTFKYLERKYSVDCNPSTSVLEVLDLIAGVLNITTDNFIKLYVHNRISPMLDITHSTSEISEYASKFPLIVEKVNSSLIIRQMLENFTKTSTIDLTGGYKTFEYVGRMGSFSTFMRNVSKRHDFWLRDITSKELHELSILDDGPGSGKTRFMQEIPFMIKKFLESQSCEAKLKEKLESAKCINISFNSAWTYSLAEAQKFTIEKSLCLRLLHQFLRKEFPGTFRSFVAYCGEMEFNLGSILQLLSKGGVNCLFISIDEVNKIYECDKVQFKELFSLIAELSTMQDLFLVPILAGTVIGPMRSALEGSNHSCLSIPLTLLTAEDSTKIFQEALNDHRKEYQYTVIPQFVDNSEILKELIEDSSGHCRILQFLFLSLIEQKQFDDEELYWKNVKEYLFITLNRIYSISKHPLAGAIIYSYISEEITEEDLVPEDRSLNFLKLCEKGYIKLVNSRVKVPGLFIQCFFKNVSKHEVFFSSFWKNLVNSDDTHWPGWEKFCILYFAFRLAMYAYLKKQLNAHNETRYSRMRISEFFNGFAISQDLANVSVMIPDEDEIERTDNGSRFPVTDQVLPPLGKCVLNATSAPFDAYFVLSTSLGPKTIFALQMKKIKAGVSNKMIIAEDTKIKSSLPKELASFPCITVFMADSPLRDVAPYTPPRSVVLCQAQALTFFGTAYHKKHLLN